ncbi:MAG: carboxypeptidase-like regulatory domain-containing protein, partial [Candidatus Cloacimonadota bacterium]|nr:carboxypeptidase-like regulatory domain-containing protein [Candidatus Cloacimonadota bacterium]
VTERYSIEHANLDIYALDVNDNPIDGATVIIGILKNNSIAFDNALSTDSEGKCTFIIGEDNQYYAKILSDYGNTEYALIIENSEDGAEYSFSINGDSAMPIPDCTEIDIPADDVDDFKIVADFEVQNEIVYGRIIMDDVEGLTHFHNPIEDGTTNFYMTDLIGYIMYDSVSPFTAFNVLEDVTTGSAEFDIPNNEYWYAFLGNKNSSNNARHIVGNISLYEYNPTEFGTIWGVVVDGTTSLPLEGATITAGIYETTTDENGEYELEVHSGTYDVFCNADNFNPEGEFSVIVDDDETVLTYFSLIEQSLCPSNVDGETTQVSAIISWDEPSILTQSKKSSIRTLNGYSIYRYCYGIEDSFQSVELISSNVEGDFYVDNSWSDVPAGMYKYGVQANYTNSQSAIIKTNYMYENMIGLLQLSISTNSNDSPVGAIITLEDLNMNPANNQTIELTDGGDIDITCMNSHYKITITKENFETYIIDDLYVADYVVETVELIELLTSITNLSVLDYQASWDEVPADEREFNGYKIIVDGSEIDGLVTETFYDLSSFDDQFHTFEIYAQYSSGQSSIKEISFENGSSINSDLLIHYDFDGNADNAVNESWNGQI